MTGRRRPRGARPFLVTLVMALALGVAASAAHAQRIVAVVNDDVVTDRDVRQRVRLALFATGQRPSDEAAAGLRPQVLRTLVDERLQMQEAERLDITVPEADIDDALDRIARNNDARRSDLEGALERAGIDPRTLRGQLRAQLAWGRVVRRELLPRVVVSDVQVAQRLQETNAGEPAYRLAEIFLPIYDAADEQRVLQDAMRLRQALGEGAEFAALARQFSAAPSAERGGDLGWLPAGSVPEELSRLVRQLPDGGVTRPVRTQEGVYLFRRLGVRSAGQSNLAISLALVEVGAGVSRGVDTLAADLRTRASDCGALREIVAGMDGLTYRRRDDVAPGDLEGRVVTVALTQPVGVLSEPLRGADGDDTLVMVCARAGGADAEQRAQVEERLRGEALERLARRYLRNLRRDAFIELRLEQG